MEGEIVTLKTTLNGIHAGTRGTIIFDYGKEMYEVEFIVNGMSFIESVHSKDLDM